MHPRCQVMINGRERSLPEWDDLFARTGFRRTGVRPMKGLHYVILAEPVSTDALGKDA